MAKYIPGKPKIVMNFMPGAGGGSSIFPISPNRPRSANTAIIRPSPNRATHCGRPHANLWVFDVTDPADMQPQSIYKVSEADSPWSQVAGTRFGAHQFQEHMTDTLVYSAWFSGGLRITDIADPLAPRETGYFIPEPVDGHPTPQTNDLDVDTRGLVYLVYRFNGFDIIEYSG